MIRLFCSAKSRALNAAVSSGAKMFLVARSFTSWNAASSPTPRSSPIERMPVDDLLQGCSGSTAVSSRTYSINFSLHQNIQIGQGDRARRRMT